MSGKDETDSAGRKQPSKYLRKKRAVKAAGHRWKHKWQLVPGIRLEWFERSLADELRHRAAVKKGGKTTGGQIREQQRLFWRWYYGDCKAQLRGPFKTVVETIERIEAAYVQRYGRKSKVLPWDGFMHHAFTDYILRPCWKMKPDAIERDLWARYELFMTAEGKALNDLLRAMLEYEDEREERKQQSKPLPHSRMSMRLNRALFQRLNA